jgi:hypothetical protein
MILGLKGEPGDAGEPGFAGLPGAAGDSGMFHFVLTF